MELVKQDTVVVETTGVTATGRMLAVLANTAMARGHVPPLFAVLMQTGRLHDWKGAMNNTRKHAKEHERGATTKPTGRRNRKTSSAR